jgi:hypothetical protein
MPNDKASLDREEILEAFQKISDELGKRSVKGELCLFGGAVMVLAFASRVSTKDVDAIFQPSRQIRAAADEVGMESGFPANWLNDAAKGFVSPNHETITGNLPQFPNLRLTMPTAEYLLAMKCLASRIGSVATDADDVNDIVFLIKHLGLKNAADVMKIVTAYYAPSRIPIKAQYLVEGLFAEGKL